MKCREKDWYSIGSVLDIPHMGYNLADMYGNTFCTKGYEIPGYTEQYNNIYKKMITKEEFVKCFECFQDANGKTVGRGSMENTWIALQYEESTKNVPAEFICSKWKQYIDNCIADKTPDRFIMSMENFINKEKYNENFGATLKGKQSSFLDKYKKSESDGKSKIINYLISVEEGPFGIHFETPEQRSEFMRVLKSNNPIFTEKLGFIIICEPDNNFRKIKLIYE